MFNPTEIKRSIFDESLGFHSKVKEVFEYQYKNQKTYREFVNNLFADVHFQDDLTSLPFLPIEFFRNHTILDCNSKTELIFESSGTTSSNNSQHLIGDADLYNQSLLAAFEHFYGAPTDYVFYGLLPSYLERSNASLVYMVEQLMQASQTEQGGFYKLNFDDLLADINNYKGERKQMIFGVTFALWEMAEQFPKLDLSNTIVMETGGMKGRRPEILREQLHEILNGSFQTDVIHSEYGMTELLSQAYSFGNGIFKCPPWMKVLVRDVYDPKSVRLYGKGVINIIDLANLHSCSFIATNDLGEVFEDGSFKILGRIDNSRLRGCNLMFAG